MIFKKVKTMNHKNNFASPSVFPGPGIDLSVVIPCYNEEASIPVFYKEIYAIFEKYTETAVSAEFIFVDDGSTDSTLNKLQDISSKDSRVHYISLSRNFGKEAAMLAGLQAAKGHYVTTIDVDLQDPPALIPQMFDAVSSGEYDCAGTRRVNRTGEPPIRSFFSRQFYFLMSKIADIKIVDGVRDFRLMNRKYVDAVLSLPERNRFSKGIFPWAGFRIKWFEYENNQRIGGSTKWPFGKLILYSLDGIIAFSTKPLAAASILGIVFFLAALILIIFIIVRKVIYGDPVNGWASTVCFILFSSGLQFFIMAILGQYIGKTYTEVKHRPHYIIKEMK
jgi:glycosyltransferase involved in cell wall biosynthesis